MKILVISTYDVTPGQNGGEARFLALYSRLAAHHEVCILAYDHRRREPVRHARLSDRLNVLTHSSTEGDWNTLVDENGRVGRYLHDILSIGTYRFSPAFISAVAHATDWADTVIVTTPFLAPIVFPMCKPRHLKVHESHNVEADAKQQYLAGSRDPSTASAFLDETIRAEAYALAECDLVTAVSAGDRDRFIEYYDCDPSKIFVVPNGVSGDGYDVISEASKTQFRQTLDRALPIVTFMGSGYGPNLDSYYTARGWLQEAGFEGTVILIGGMIDGRDATAPPVNFSEKWLGFVDQNVKELILSSSDFALQIVTTGGGTNLKVFDYMAAGRPIVANAFGARGIVDSDWYLKVDSAADMADLLKRRSWETDEGLAAASRAREIVAASFDWDVIAARYEDILCSRRNVDAAPPSDDGVAPGADTRCAKDFAKSPHSKSARAWLRTAHRWLRGSLRRVSRHSATSTLRPNRVAISKRPTAYVYICAIKTSLPKAGLLFLNAAINAYRTGSLHRLLGFTDFGSFAALYGHRRGGAVKMKQVLCDVPVYSPDIHISHTGSANSPGDEPKTMLLNDDNDIRSRRNLLICDPTCVLSYGHAIPAMHHFEALLAPRFENTYQLCSKALPDKYIRIFGDDDAQRHVSEHESYDMLLADPFLNISIADAEAVLDEFDCTSDDVIYFPGADFYGPIGFIGACAKRAADRRPKIMIRLIGVLETASAYYSDPLQALLDKINGAQANGTD
eukprot:gene21038-21806_t